MATPNTTWLLGTRGKEAFKTTYVRLLFSRGHSGIADGSDVEPTNKAKRARVMHTTCIFMKIKAFDAGQPHIHYTFFCVILLHKTLQKVSSVGKHFEPAS